MQQVTNQQRLKPWMGFVLFALLMVYFIFVCVPMQTAWGIWGLIATEVSFLVIAIVYGLIFRISLKEMFPIKKFTARDFFGGIFLVIGGTLIGLISVAVIAILVPSALEGGDVEAITDMMISGPGYILLMLIIAVMPAICEEAIHRGAILTSFRSIKKDWVIVLIMAVFFGINHMSVLRFINTAILGACLSYVVVKKNNILLSSIMHFTVNFSASTISYIASLFLKKYMDSGLSGSDIASAMGSGAMRNALPAYLFYGAAAPILIVLGLMLLNPSSHKKIRFLFAGIISVLMLSSAIGLAVFSASSAKVLQSTVNYKVTAENTEAPALDLDIEEDGDYTLICVLMQSDGIYYAKITDERGNVVSENEIPAGSIRTLTANMHLESGKYKLILVNGKGTVGDNPTFSIQMKKLG